MEWNVRNDKCMPQAQEGVAHANKTIHIYIYRIRVRSSADLAKPIRPSVHRLKLEIFCLVYQT